MNWTDRIASCDRATGFPRSLSVAGDGRVAGAPTAAIGARWAAETGAAIDPGNLSL